MRCESMSFGELSLAFRKENIACTFRNRVLIALLYDESPKYVRNVVNLSLNDRASYPRIQESSSNQSVVCSAHVLTTANELDVNPE